jgi:plastocyanin
MLTHVPRPAWRASTLAGVVIGAACLLTACGSTPPSTNTGSATIAPGAGQSLAGTPGAAQAGGSPMPGMTMPTPSGATGGAAPGGAPAPVSGHSVAIKNFAFSPASLTVSVGTTVTWTNQDGDAHTVTSQGTGGPLASPSLTTGARYSYTFTKAGTYAYLCTIHPFMTATVRVTP